MLTCSVRIQVSLVWKCSSEVSRVMILYGTARRAVESEHIWLLHARVTVQAEVHSCGGENRVIFLLSSYCRGPAFGASTLQPNVFLAETTLIIECFLLGEERYAVCSADATKQTEVRFLYRSIIPIGHPVRRDASCVMRHKQE